MHGVEIKIAKERCPFADEWFYYPGRVNAFYARLKYRAHWDVFFLKNGNSIRFHFDNRAAARSFMEMLWSDYPTVSHACLLHFPAQVRFTLFGKTLFTLKPSMKVRLIMNRKPVDPPEVDEVKRFFRGFADWLTEQKETAR